MDETLVTHDESAMTYHQLGFQLARKSSSHIKALGGLLATVYNHFLKRQELDEKGIESRINQLTLEIEQEKERQNDLSAGITSQRELIEEKKERIQELTLQRIDLKKSESNGEDETSSEIVPFIIATFITLLLTLYLFLFYSSTGFSVFYGIDDDVSGFINSDVFSMAKDKGNGALIFVILFPVLFLAVGFVLHSILEKNKIKRKKNKRQNYFGLIAILLVTFVADSIIGYKISQGVHNNEFNLGLTSTTWEFEMIYSDINFYMVLILGFVAYVIWGVLLNYVLSNSFLKSYSERTKLLIENINERIQTLREDLSKLTSDLNKLESDLKTILNRIEGKQKSINHYQGNVFPIDTALLRAAIGEFMGGYQTYTTNNLGNTRETKNHIQQAIEVQEKWLSDKINSLPNLP